MDVRASSHRGRADIVSLTLAIPSLTRSKSRNSTDLEETFIVPTLVSEKKADFVPQLFIRFPIESWFLILYRGYDFDVIS